VFALGQIGLALTSTNAALPNFHTNSTPLQGHSFSGQDGLSEWPRRLNTMIRLLAGFFAFGAAMCALTIVLLISPGSALDSLWGLNPEARVGFQSLGNAAILLMFVVGAGCAFATIGLWRRSLWGIRIALIILWLNIIGDLFNALGRHDYRALIGLPIGGAMIFYLARYRKADNSSLG
jgi:hypothetical protein